MNELHLIQGESVNWEFVYADSEGTPMDITYYNVVIAAREHLGTRKSLFRYETNVDIGVMTKKDAANGVTAVTIKDTTGFTPGKYVLEMAYVHGSGNVSKPDQVFLHIHEGLL